MAPWEAASIAVDDQGLFELFGTIWSDGGIKEMVECTD
jgi:hypothetical protein